MIERKYNNKNIRHPTGLHAFIYGYATSDSQKYSRICVRFSHKIL